MKQLSFPSLLLPPWWFPFEPAHDVQILWDYAANTISGIFLLCFSLFHAL